MVAEAEAAVTDEEFGLDVPVAVLFNQLPCTTVMLAAAVLRLVCLAMVLVWLLPMVLVGSVDAAVG